MRIPSVAGNDPIEVAVAVHDYLLGCADELLIQGYVAEADLFAEMAERWRLEGEILQQSWRRRSPVAYLDKTERLRLQHLAAQHRYLKKLEETSTPEEKERRRQQRRKADQERRKTPLARAQEAKRKREYRLRIKQQQEANKQGSQ